MKSTKSRKPGSTPRSKPAAPAADAGTPERTVQRSDYPGFEKRLRARWLALCAEIRQTLNRTDQEQYADIAGQVRDAEDEALADLIVDINHAEVARDVEELRDIEAALERIATGSYGACLSCGIGIPRERLEAYPTAKRCLPCQQQHERTRMQPPKPTL